MSTTLFIKAKCSKKVLLHSLNISKKLEEKFSVYKNDSLISLINKNAYEKEVVIDEEVYKVISQALEISQKSDGKFDITVGAITQKAYKFGHREEVLPLKKNLKKSLLGVNYKNIILTKTTIKFLHKDTYIDLGGIVKGYCVDKIQDYLLSSGVKKALVSLGGEIACYGDTFTIGIGHPRGTKGKLYATYTSDKDKTYISRSGDYERYINTYETNHIINPRTAFSSNEFASLTLVSKKIKTTALDAYNTAMFLMSKEEFISLAQEESIYYFCIEKNENYFSSYELDFNII